MARKAAEAPTPQQQPQRKGRTIDVTPVKATTKTAPAAVPLKRLPAVRKTNGGEVTKAGDWKAELARYAAKTVKMEESTQSSTRISTKGGVLKYHDTPLKDNQVTCIILAGLIENAYYDGPYDPNNPKAPVCFAFSEDGDGMAPHEKAHDPQHETCDGCPRNEWGSASVGRGKACKNIRRLGLLSCDEVSMSGIEDGEIATLEVSVTSVKSYSGYVKQLALNGSAPWAWQTVITLDREPGKEYSNLSFQSADRKPIPEKYYPAILARVKEAEKLIDQPYIYMEQAVQQPVRRGKVEVKAKAKGKF